MLVLLTLCHQGNVNHVQGTLFKEEVSSDTLKKNSYPKR